jgi:hypothetical protein
MSNGVPANLAQADTQRGRPQVQCRMLSRHLGLKPPTAGRMVKRVEFGSL